MKKISSSIIAIVLIFAIPAFVVSHFNPLKWRKNNSTAFKSDHFEPKNEYLIDKSFVFILYSSDPAPQGLTQNLNSIFNQKYDKFRLLVLLTENLLPSLDAIQKTAAKVNKESAISFMPLREKMPTLDSFKQAIEQCKDNEIIIHMDATGWLANDNVLATLNQIYASSEEIWFTHCPTIAYPAYKKSPENIPWHSSHFKTYYAGLLKQLPLSSSTHPLNDSTLNRYLRPLAKNSRKHIHFVEAALYIRNQEN